jgi:hypothetical protein
MMSKEDEMLYRSLRAMYNANESAFALGKIGSKEYEQNLNTIGMQIVYLEEKYGLYEEL